MIEPNTHKAAVAEVREEVCDMCAKECGCAYYKGEGPDQCPLLAVHH